jgi:hypothetical protein
MTHATYWPSSESLTSMIASRPARVLVLTAFILAIFLFGSPRAFAQKTSGATTGTTTTSGAKPPPKKTTVNFEDQLIEGQTQKPELFYLLQQRSPNFKRLIKLRENFLPEMQDTAEDMNRSGTGH